MPIGAFVDDAAGCQIANQCQAKAKANLDANTSEIDWGQSVLNPRNRLLSLGSARKPKWRIDGCDSQGTQLQALPVYLQPHLLPMRVDIFIPDQSQHPPGLRDVLDSAASFCIRDHRAADLGISKLVLQALELWTEAQPDFAGAFHALPFGSRIVVQNVCASPYDMRVHMVPDHGAERQLLTLEELRDTWKTHGPFFPRCIDLWELQHRQQIHDTISVVLIPCVHSSELFVFKSSVHDVKYMYHELKLLLTMEPCPHVMPPPLFLVTHKARYGGPDKVYGFILRYYPAGNLADALGARAAAGTLRLGDQFRWAEQVTRTLIHLHGTVAAFYPELKADNLLLAPSHAGEEDVLFIDFEQMGNWYSYSAPEIHYLEYALRLSCSDAVPEVDRKRYAALATQHLPPDPSSSHLYQNPPHGYYRPWLGLTHNQREAAEAFSLGKLLWCIFEGCADTRSSLLKAFRAEPLPTSDMPPPAELGIEFPSFKLTPEPVRALIRRCTQNDPLWHAANGAATRGVVRVGSKVYPRGRTGVGGEPLGTAAEARTAAREGWRETVSDMEAFLEAWTRWKEGQAEETDEHLLGFRRRPTLREVLDELKEVARQSGC